MHVAELMTFDPQTVAPYTKIIDAKSIAASRGIRHLPVTYRGELTGILCVCDLERGTERAPVASVMSSEVVTVSPETLAVEAAIVMRERGIGCLPVLRGGRIIGIVSRGDLLRAGIFPSLLVGSRRCTSCKSHHDVVNAADGASFFCRECLEHSSTGDLTDDSEIGVGD